MRRRPRLPALLVSLLLGLAAFAWADPPGLSWEDVWSGPDSASDEAHLTVVAPDGAVYVSGTVYRGGVGGTREDIFLSRYAAGGGLEWTRFTTTDGADIPGALVLDHAGHPVLAGHTAADTSRVVLMKYDPSGDLLWRSRHDVQPSSGQATTPRLVQGTDGSLTVATRDDDQARVLRYDSDGALLWSTSLPTGGNLQIFGLDVAVDAAGAAYAAGIFSSSTSFFLTAQTFKLDAAGAVQWSHTENGNFNSFFEFVGVAVGPDGHPVVAANPESTCGLFELRIWKLDAASGALRWWNRLLESDPCHVYQPVDMAMDAQGNALVASHGRTSGSFEHIQTSRWSPAGDLHWYREFDGPGTSSDQAAALILDSSGAVYAAGLTTHPPQNRDIVAVKYAADGAEQWSVAWGAPFGGNDWAADIALGPAGQVAVVGTGWNGPPTGQDAVVLLYQEDVASAAPPADPATGLALQALGNPIDGPTDIRFALPRGGAYTLSVLDLRGREVRRIRQGTADAGEHLAAWSGRDDQGRPLPSGAYLLRLRTPRGEAVRRVAVVR